ncbi:DUF2341 domain-containing protein [Elusimicrobiota bacterium]
MNINSVYNSKVKLCVFLFLAGMFMLLFSSVSYAEYRWGMQNDNNETGDSGNSGRMQSGISPDKDNMRITHIASCHPESSGNIRLGCWTGGLSGNPDGAILIVQTGNESLTQSGWTEFSVTGANWPKNTRTWVGYAIGSTPDIYYTNNSGNTEDFDNTDGRTHQPDGLAVNPADAHADITSDSNEAGFWYYNYLVYVLYPTIDSMNDTMLEDGQTGVQINGAGFEADDEFGNNANRVFLGTAATWGQCGTLVEQTDTAWLGTQIAFTVSKGALSYGTNYVYVRNDDSQVNTNGYQIKIINVHPPQNADLNNVNISSATLSWDAEPTADGYILQASIQSDFASIDGSSFTANVSQSVLTVEGLSVNTTYYLRAGILFAPATEWMTAPVYFATSTLVSKPGSGTPPITDVYFTSATVQWTAGSPANPAWTEYELECSSESIGGTVVISSVTTDTSVLFSSLVSDTTYYFRVRARNNSGIYTNWEVLGSTKTLKDTISPEAIDDLSVEEGSDNGEIDIQWTAPGDDADVGQAAKYIVKYSAVKINEASWNASYTHAFGQDWTPQSAGNTEQHTVSGLVPGGKYYIAIKAQDETPNTSAISNSPFAYAQSDSIKPCAISDISAQVGDYKGEVKITWTAPGDDGTTGTVISYLVKYATYIISSEQDFNDAATYNHTWTPLAAGNSEEHAVDGLTPGVTYWIAIKGVDDKPNYGELSTSNPSDSAHAQSDNVAPAGLTDLNAILAAESLYNIDLVWSAPGDDGWENNIETGTYRIDYATYVKVWDYSDYEIEITTHDVIPEEAQDYRIGGIIEGPTYYFRIWTKDYVGNWSEISNGATVWASWKPDKITDLQALTGTGEGEVELSWTAPGDDRKTGTASYYIIKYSTEGVITEGNWNVNNDIETDEPSPSVSGADEQLTVTGLPKGDVYFGIKTVDDIGNESYLNDPVPVTTVNEIKPSAVADLTAEQGASKGQIKLTWTAPGDDGTSGTASFYDIRYNNVQINGVNWGASTEVDGEPSPSPQGSDESMIVVGLTEGVTYYFAIKAADERENISDISDSPNAPASTAEVEKIAPSAVTDLSAGEGLLGGEVDLAWTAPGDNRKTGTADKYIIRYSTETIFDLAESGGGSWSYRMPVNIYNNESQALTDYQVYVGESDIGVDAVSKMQSDYDDVRFTCKNGPELDYAIVPNVNEFEGFYVRVPYLEAGQWTTIYMYYGNSSAGAGERPDSAYDFWEDFDDYTLWWQHYGDADNECYNDTEDGKSAVYIDDDFNNAEGIGTLASDYNVQNKIIEWSAKADISASDLDAIVGVGPSWLDQWYCTENLRHQIGDVSGGQYHIVVCGANESAGSVNFPSGSWEEGKFTIGSGQVWGKADFDGTERTASGSPVYTGMLMLSCDNETGSNEGFWVDWLRIRQYIASEPTITTGSEEEDSYTPNWNDAANVSGEPTPSASGTLENMTVDNLIEGGTYYFALKSEDDVASLSFISNYSSSTARSILPAAITDFAALPGTSSGEIELNWTAPGDDDWTGQITGGKWRIDYSTDSSYQFQVDNYKIQITTTCSPDTDHSYTEGNLPEGATYYFRIWTRDEVAGHWSGISNGATSWVKVVSPAAIADFTAVTGQDHGTIDLSWTSPGDDGSSGQIFGGAYRIKYSSVAAKNWSESDYQIDIPTTTDPGLGQGHIITGLTGGVTYYFWIRTRDELLWNWSALSNKTTIWAQNDLTAPEAIDDLTAQEGSSNGEIDIQWTAPGDDMDEGQAVNYAVKYSTVKINEASWNASYTHTFGQDWMPQSAGNTEQHTVTGLVPGDQYYIAIKTQDERPNISAVSNSPLADAQSDPVPPCAISDISAQPGTYEGQITISWSAPGDDGTTGTVTSYLVKYATYAITSNQDFSDAATYNQSWTPLSAGSGEEHDMEGLTPGVTYWVAIKGADEKPNYGELSSSNPSSSAFAEWDKINPGSIADLAGSLAGDSLYNIDLTWSAPGDDASEHNIDTGTYRIDYATYSKVWNYSDYQVEISTYDVIQGEDQSYRIGSIEEGSTYYFRIWTKDNADNWSDISNGTTVWANWDPDKVTDLNAQTGSGESEVDLTWTAPGDDWTTGTVSYYMIKYSTEGTITEGNWNTSNDIATAEPAPLISGTNQQLTVTGLPKGNAFFGIKAVDDIGNIAELNTPVPVTTVNEIKPSAVADLAAVKGSSMGQIKLTWTAPGDDGTTGTASAYDIRYNNTQITGANWAVSSVIYGEPVPSSQGTGENTIVGGLTAGNTYYFAIKSIDERGNLSDISNSPNAPASTAEVDEIAPVAVTDLTAAEGSEGGKVDLTWTAPGDNRRTGTANMYILKYSAGPVFDLSNSGGGSWSYRMPINIYNNESQSLIDYQVYVSDSDIGVEALGKMQADYDDVRFMYKKGPELDYSISPDISSFKGFYVRIPYLPAGQWTTIYMYYDNSNASAGRRPDSTFDYWDDFNDLNKWSNVDADSFFDTTDSGRSALYVEGGTAWRYGRSNDVFELSNTISELMLRAANANADLDFSFGLESGTPNANYGFIDLGHCRDTTGGGGTVRLYTNGGFVSGSTGIDGTYRIYTTIVAAGFVRGIYNGETVTNSVVPTVTNDNMAMGSDDDGGSGAYVDWIRIRQYTASEPTVTTGSEEAGTYTSNWPDAADVTGEPSPSAAGSNESITVNALVEGVTYYFALKSEDDAANMSFVSNYSSAPARSILPAAVADFTAVPGITDGEIDLLWSAPGDDGSTGVLNGEYRIDYATYSKSWNVSDYQISIVTSNVTPDDSQSYTVEELDGLTTYYFRIWTRDEVAEHWSKISNSTYTWAQAISPAAVTGLSALKGTSGGEIDLSWTAPGDDNWTGQLDGKWRIDYSTDSGHTFQLDSYKIEIDTVCPPYTDHSYTISALTEGATYYIRIWSSDDVDNWSDVSNAAQIWAKREAPASINDLTAAPGSSGGEIGLTWTAAGNNGNIGDIANGEYLIKYTSNSIHSWIDADYSLQWPTSTVPGQLEGKPITGLTEGVTYYFWVRTSDDRGNWSGLSNKATTWAQSIPPAAITSLAAVPGGNGGEIDLSWTASGDDGWTGQITNGKWRIDYSTDSGYSFDVGSYKIEIDTTCLPYTDRTYTVTALTEGATYYFRIWTRDEVSGNWSDISNTVFTDAKREPPAAVTDLSAIPGTTGGELDLSWTAPGDNTYTGDITDGKYQIKFTSNSSVDWGTAGYDLLWATNTVPGHNEVKVISGLTEGVTYYFWIKTADDEENWSGLSNKATTWAQAIAPAAITNLSALTAAQMDIIDLTWSAPGDDSWTGAISDGVFRIDYSTYIKTWDHADYEIEIATSNMLADSSNGRSVTGLVEGATYYFRIWTSDEADLFSNESNAASAMTRRVAPAAITDLLAQTGDTGGEIDLLWSAPGDDGWNSVLGTVDKQAEFRIQHTSITVEAQNSGWWDRSNAQIVISTYNVNPGDDCGYVFEELNQGVTYYFRIWTSDEVGTWSTISEGATTWAQVSPDTTPPGTIINFSAQPGSTGGDINLTWTAPGDDGYIGDIVGGEYRIQYSTLASPVEGWNKDNWDIKWSTNITEGGSESRGVEDLIEGATYYFRIWTRDEVSNNWSDMSNGATTYARREAPRMITDLTAQPGSRGGYIQLDWSAPGDDNGSGVLNGEYRIDHATYSKAWSYAEYEMSITASGINPDENQSRTVTDLTEGVTYYFRIWTIDDADNRSLLSNNTTNYAKREPPQAVADLSAAQGAAGGDIDLAWSAPGDDTGDGILNGEYRIDYATYTKSWDNTQYKISIATSGVVPQDSQDYAITGLAEGVTYYFRLWTLDDVDNVSGISNSTMTWAQAIAPAAVTDLSGVSDIAEEIRLSWSAPGDDGLTGLIQNGQFKIQYSSETSVSWDDSSAQIVISTSVAPHTNRDYKLTGLNEGTTYYFRIWTCDESGIFSDGSNISTTCVVRVPPAVVDDLTAVTGRYKAVTLSWTAPKENNTYGGKVDQYDVRYASESFTAAQWNAAWVTQAGGEPAPLDPGQSQSMYVLNLNQGTTYYFRIRSIDEEGNISPISAEDSALPGDASSIPWNDDIEAGGDAEAGSWEKNTNCATEWERGTPAVSQAAPQYYSASNCWGTDLDADHASYADIQLIIPEIDITSANEPVFRFWHYINITEGPYDGVLILISTNSGVDWSEIPGSEVNPTYDGVLTSGYGNVYGGKNSWHDSTFGWKKVTVDLNNYIGKVFSIKFCLGSDDSNNSPGWFIDNVYVGEEETPPAAVTDLEAALGSIADTIDLTWTAPGDDGWTGQIVNGKWRIDYSTDSGHIFDGSTYKIEIDTTCQPHTDHSYALTALTEGATYYFRIWTKDEITNWSDVSNAAYVHMPKEPPAAVTDLSAIPGTTGGIIDLSWTAPGDNTYTGDITDGKYQIKFTSNSSVDWGTAGYDLLWATNTVPGHNEVKVISGLTEGVTYYFWIKTADDEENWSGLSNKATTWAQAIAPAAITNLSALTAAQMDIIDLTWSAPGDDSWTGAISDGVFRIDYSTYIKTWDHADYEIEIATSNMLADSSNGRSVTGLVEGATYYFRIWTSDEADLFSNESNAASAMTRRVAPAAITDLLAQTGDTGGEIDLLWSAPGDDGWNSVLGTVDKQAEFRIQHTSITVEAQNSGWWDRSNAQIVISTYNVNPGDDCGYVFEELNQGVTYYFRIWTSDEVGTWSTISEGATTWAQVSPDTTPPGTIINFSAQPGSTGGDINLTWTAPGDDGYIGDIVGGEYRIQYSTLASPVEGWNKDNWDIKWSTNITEGGSESRGVEDLIEGATYYFRIWTRDEVSNNWSDMSNGATTYARREAPRMITDLTAQPGSRGGYIQLDWSAPGDDNGSGVLNGEYRIDHATYSKAWSYAEYEMSITASGINPDENQSRTVTDLTEGVTYYFRIWTIDDADNRSLLSNNTTNYAKREPPQAVADLSAAQGAAGGDIDLAWSAPGDDTGDGILNGEYRIDYATYTKSWDNTQYKISIATSGVVPQDSQDYAITGLAEGVTYYFRLWTLDDVDNVSGISNSTMTWAQAIAPAAVTDLSGVSDIAEEIRLSWSAPGDDGLTGLIQNGQFKIQYSSETSVSWDDSSAQIVISTSVAPHTNRDYKLTGLNEGTTYYFRIWTCDESGIFSDGSNISTTCVVRVPPAVVDDLTAVTGRYKAVTLSWTAPKENNTYGGKVDQYDVRYASESFTAAQWNAAWVTQAGGEPAPLDPGQSQSMYVLNLNQGTTYYFRIRSIDEEGNISPISAEDSALPGDASSIPWNDDIEAGGDAEAGSWEKNTNCATEWERGTPAVSQAAPQYYSASNCWGTDLDADHASYADIQLIIPEIDITSANEPVLRFWHYLDVEGGPYDGALIQISTNSGVDWSEIPGGLITPSYNGVLNSGYGNVYGGKSAWYNDTGGWEKVTVDLNNYKGKVFSIKFCFGSDDSNNAPGWFIDDVYVGEEEIPPAVVTDMSAAAGAVVDTIDLTWTAPGDSGSTGDITGGKYGVKFATYPGYSWGSASSFNIDWSTDVSAGSNQDYTVTGLNEGTTYYFRLWTADEVPNWSDISNGATNYARRQAPAAVTNLSALAGISSGEIKLKWTAPGDNGLNGILLSGSEYRIDYSTYIKSWLYSDYKINIPTSNVNPGDDQSASVTGLDENREYYLRIWTSDEAGTWSSLSNAATCWSLASVPDVTCHKATGTWYNDAQFIFVNQNKWGQSGVAYYRYVWDKNTTHTWTDSETQWSGGNSTSTASSEGSWYFHVRSYNNDGIGIGGYDYGPFNYDITAPVFADAAFRSRKSNDSWVTAAVSIIFSDLTSGFIYFFFLFLTLEY